MMYYLIQTREESVKTTYTYFEYRKDELNVEVSKSSL